MNIVSYCVHCRNGESLQFPHPFHPPSPSILRILSASLRCGHFAHWGREPGESWELGVEEWGSGGVEDWGAVPRNPNSQSAEHACTRQMRSRRSTLGEFCPLSYLAYCTRFTPIAAENAACDSVPRSSFNLVANMLITFLLQIYFTLLTHGSIFATIPTVAATRHRVLYQK